MAEPFLIVGIVLILFAAFLVFTFFSSASFVLNLIILIALFFIYSGSSFAESILELGGKAAYLEHRSSSNSGLPVCAYYLQCP